MTRLLHSFSSLSFLIFVYFLSLSSCVIPTVNIGSIFPMFSEDLSTTAVQYQAAILMAIREINNKTDGIHDDILPNTILKIASRSSLTKFSRAASASLSLTTAFGGQGVRAVIGPASSSSLAGAAPILAEAKALAVGYCAQSAIFSQPDIYPNVLRMNPSVALQGQLFADIMMGRPNLFLWGRVSLITCTDIDSRSISSDFKFRMLSTYLDLGLILSETEIISGTTSFDDVFLTLRAKKSRVFLLFCPASVGVPLLLGGYRDGVFRQGTQILGKCLAPAFLRAIGTSAIPKTLIMGSKKLYDPLEISQALTGFITVSLTIDYRNSNLNDFVTRWRKQKSTKGIIDPITGIEKCDNTTDDDGGFYLYQGLVSPSITDSALTTLPIYRNQLKCAGLDFSSFKVDGSDIARDTYFAYDSLITVAKGLHQLLYQSEDKDSIKSQSQITYDLLLNSIVNHVQYDGVTGHIRYPTDKPIGYQGRGDRTSDAVYLVLNFNSTAYLSFSQKIAFTGDEGMVVIGTINSESTFQLCTEFTPNSKNCPQITFNTVDNTPPKDRPNLETLKSSVVLEILTKIIAIGGILIACVYAICLFHLRDARIIRVSQPELAYLILLGCVFCCVTSYLLSSQMSRTICSIYPWFGHLGFALICAPLIIKLLRMELVLNSGLVKRSFTIQQTFFAILVLILVLVSLLTSSFLQSPPTLRDHIITDDQESHTLEKYCSFGHTIFSNCIYSYEGILIGIGIILCYQTSHLPQGLSGCGAATTALFTVISSVAIITPIIYFVTNLLTSTQYFLMSLIFSLASIRIATILYFPLISNIIQGFDYDRKFNLVKVHEGLKFYESLLELKRYLFKSQVTVQPAISKYDAAENSERSRIQGEIERLNMRLDLLANRALYHSRISQRIGEISLGPSYDGDDATVDSISSEMPPKKFGIFQSVSQAILEEDDEEKSFVTVLKPAPSYEMITSRVSHCKSEDVPSPTARSSCTSRRMPTSPRMDKSAIIRADCDSARVEDFNDEHFDSSNSSESLLTEPSRRRGWEEVPLNPSNSSVPHFLRVGSEHPTQVKDTSFLGLPSAKRALPPIITRKATM